MDQGPTSSNTPLKIRQERGGGRARLETVAGHRDTSQTIRQVVEEYAPSKPDEDYIAEYEANGHTPEVAKCLAASCEAGENVIEADVLHDIKREYFVVYARGQRAAVVCSVR